MANRKGNPRATQQHVVIVNALADHFESLAKMCEPHDTDDARGRAAAYRQAAKEARGALIGNHGWELDLQARLRELD